MTNKQLELYSLGLLILERQKRERRRKVRHIVGQFFLYAFALLCIVALIQAWNGVKPCEVNPPAGQSTRTAPLRLC